jgi:hypothetical protein
MEKLSRQAYKNKSLVKCYEDKYIHDSLVKEDVKFEIEVVQKVSTQRQTNSWCDVACGTGYHLRTAPGSYKRVGIDLSDLMIEEYRHDTQYNINYVITDVLEMNTNDKYDLVTNFWFGYTHQETLDLVLLFFKKMIDLTSTSGSIILSFHDNWSLFEQIPQKTVEPYGGIFSFDALVWSYSEPNIPNCTYKCISPHKDLIIKTFAPYFLKYRVLDYPQNKFRKILLLEGKL